ncbi:stage II sporulation protein P [Caldicellulosiruptor bescii]|uniref:Stage II sporulation protein P n=2 Tax=Caldicellulosiruptor bescii TaxID=31899 RepID=B9MKM4_CALBD|nr:stage II sporulation protein P [Caldicellulosiruptor bescii]ACM60882.1 stage II sporulation protein P [Caldicellulosiruptor bescii DSM 6725]PBC89300.1 stage II sporulation protein P [Caldicellulosiruptor bescii]PBC91215.1 stage II sporulation protein P [Caldicellulosiruptor bescii]PBD03371.1 stage II sporulation protein P [Caldicellulosiruptor bescii]PBD07014.1 stage II sporulation protein P [Caldicellulosiruptor bescii]
MVKVVDFKKVVLVTTILFVVGVGFLVERLVFSNQVATAVLFSYSKEIISFNIPIFSDHFANKIIKIENIVRFSYPMFAGTNFQEVEGVPLYEDDAIMIDYNQQTQEDKKNVQSESQNENIEFQKYFTNSTQKVGTCNNIEIMNQTDYKIDANILLKTNFKIFNGKKPSILIYHTHTTESYNSFSQNLVYTPGTTDRTLDFNYNVVRVGEELKRILEKQYGYKVYHSKDVNDYPEYKGSYSRSLKVIEKYKSEHPDIKVFIDLHRDAIGNGSKKVKVSTVAFGYEVAKVMLVVGTDKLGLYHPFWRQNLLFAVHLQKNLSKICPQITRPINLSAARYNQHVSPYAIIIEIGSNGNTLEEALRSCQIVAKALDDTIMGR